jgi:peptidoglycan L-alanyl-D-glutamate endopeptidase CwlK
MDLAPTKKAVQAELKKRGLYDGEIDGLDGSKTWKAISDALLPEGVVVQPTSTPPEDKADPRSESFIETLNPAVQPLARQFILLLNAKGVDAKIISGFRTYEEQKVLYDKFKRGGPQAAPPGYSNHNFGLAFDIGIFEGDKYLEESPLYRQAGAIGKSVGLMWGGDWSGRAEDEPHYEFRPAWAAGFTENQALSEYRERLKKGLAIV